MSAVFDKIPSKGKQDATLIASQIYIDKRAEQEDLNTIYDALRCLEAYKDTVCTNAQLYKYVLNAYDTLFRSLLKRYADLVAGQGPGNKDAQLIYKKLCAVEPEFAKYAQTPNKAQAKGGEGAVAERDALYREYFPAKSGRPDLRGYESDDSDDEDFEGVPTFRRFDCTPDANQVLQRVKRVQDDGVAANGEIERAFHDSCADIFDAIRASTTQLIATIDAHAPSDQRLLSLVAAYVESCNVRLTEKTSGQVCRDARQRFQAIIDETASIEAIYSGGAKYIDGTREGLELGYDSHIEASAALNRGEILHRQLNNAVQRRRKAFADVRAFDDMLAPKLLDTNKKRGDDFHKFRDNLKKSVADGMRDWELLYAQLDEQFNAYDEAGDIAARDASLAKEGTEIGIAGIYYDSTWTDQEERDFEAAQKAFVANDLSALAALKTKFFIAQYRGITYNTYKFTAPERRNSREKVELDLPVYSASVFVKAGISAERYYDGQYHKSVDAELQKHAEQLRTILLEKRSSGPVNVAGYKYDNAAEALQDMYTNRYDYCFDVIGDYLNEQEKAKGLAASGGSAEAASTAEPPDEWQLCKDLYNAANPMVSTGDMPRHALKYAYGMKAYSGHENEILNPYWDANGNTTWPYAGKVFALLFGLEDYVRAAPLHVTSLNSKARIRVAGAIAEERETTFPSFIERKRVVAEHIAKYPSFPGDAAGSGYDHKIHLQKYGLDKDDFLKFYTGVRAAEVQRSGAYRNIGSWLVNYHEARLIELARRLAKQRGGLLVYRDDLGNLAKGLTPIGDIHAPRIDALTKDEAEPMVLRKARVYDFKNAGAVEKLLKSRKSGPRVDLSGFDEFIKGQGTEHDVPGDGNCLFHALGGALVEGGHRPLGTDDVSIREKVCDGFPRYPLLRARQGITDAYLAEMRQYATSAGQLSRWGSDAEIMMFCRAYNARVTVYSPTYPAPDYCAAFDADNDRVPSYDIKLVHRHGNHWRYLTPRM